MVIVTLAYPACMLLNTNLQTCTVNHGVIIGILVLYLIPYEREYKVRE